MSKHSKNKNKNNLTIQKSQIKNGVRYWFVGEKLYNENSPLCNLHNYNGPAVEQLIFALNGKIINILDPNFYINKWYLNGNHLNVKSLIEFEAHKKGLASFL